jgi:hypothetical protein
MTVNVDEQNYRREQSYNLALAIWSLVEQNAASLRAEGASDATISVVQRDASPGYRQRFATPPTGMRMN